ncbi:MAG: hypothetical protein IAG13_24475 [Deltaproteobacteria bacterium]|nr:hypothetical protein [Nannocystaceae bacterium]
MPRAIALACWVSLSACFADPPRTDSGDDTGSGTAHGETTATSEGSSTSTVTSASSADAEATSETLATVDDSGTSSGAPDESTGADDETLVLDLDVAVCDAQWLDDFGASIECPSVRTNEAAVRSVVDGSVFVEALAIEVAEDAFVTQPRVGAQAELRGRFVLKSIAANTRLRGTLICQYANDCLAEITIAVTPVERGPTLDITTTDLDSTQLRGLPLDLELPAWADAVELLVTVRADLAGGADTVVWISPRLVLAQP